MIEQLNNWATCDHIIGAILLLGILCYGYLAHKVEVLMWIAEEDKGPEDDAKGMEDNQ